MEKKHSVFTQMHLFLHLFHFAETESLYIIQYTSKGWKNK